MTPAQLLIVVLALLAANLPFATSRLFFSGLPRRNQVQMATSHWRGGWPHCICCLASVATLFETQAYGELHAQGRQFYAVTTCLFIVFAYPGFVARYLWRRHKG